MKMKLACFLFTILALFLVLPQFSFAQKQLFQQEILSSAVSKDGKRLAVNDPTTVYIYSLPELKLLHKWTHNRNTILVKGFHPSNPDILITRNRNIPAGRPANQMQLDMMESDQKYWIHPEDSLLVWSIERKEIVQAMPGNYHMYFGSGTDKVAGIANLYNDFTSKDGRLLHASRGAQIFTKNGTMEKESTTDKSARSLEVTDDLRYYAATWYKYQENGLSYSFTINDFSTHEPIFTIENLYDLPYEFTFSPSGNYLAIAGAWNKEALPTIKLIDVKQGKIVHEIDGIVKANYDKIFSLSFSADEKLLHYSTKETWTAYDIKSGSVINKVDGGLADMFFIQDAIVMKDRLFFVGSQFNPEGYTTNFGFINSVSAGFMQVHTAIAKATVSSYADSTTYTMMVNSTVVDYTRPSIQFNPSKSMFAASRENRLEAWIVDKRKKILDLGFDKNIKAFPSLNGKNILVIEDKGSASGGGFTLHGVSLDNSTVNTSAVIPYSYDGMKNTIDCDCVPKTNESWYCIDGGNKLWEVSSRDFSAKQVVMKEGAEFKQIQSAGEAIYLLADTDQEDVIYKWHENKLDEQAKAIAINLFAITNNNIIIGHTKEKELDIWSANKKQHTIILSAPPEFLDVSPGLNHAIVQYTEANKKKIQKITPGVTTTPFEVEGVVGNYHLLPGDDLLSANEGYKTLLNNGSYVIEWAVQTPQLVNYHNFDVSSNGDYIVYDKLLINLKNVETKAVGNLSDVNLLSDSAGITTLELVSTIYGNNPGFGLYRINLDKKDTVKTTDWIKIPKDADLIGSVHDKLRTSDNKKWAVTYTEPSSFKQAIPPKALVWNTKTLKFTQIPVKVTHAEFLQGGDILMVYSDDKRYYYNVNPFRLLKTTDAYLSTDISFEDKLFLRNDNGKILLQEKKGDTAVTVKTIHVKESFQRLILQKESDQVVGYSTTGKVYVWSISGDVLPKKIIQVHSAPIVRTIERAGLIYSLSENGEIAIFSPTDAKLKVVLKLLKKNDQLRLAMVTPDGHYKIDQDLINDLHFIKNGEVFPVSSFDLIGNRPDKVYEAIGKADVSLISNLKKSWEARIRRLGLDPNSLTTESTRPVVNWNATDLPSVTSNETVRLQYNVSDAVNPIKSVYLRVNGVPVYGRKGLIVKGSTKTSGHVVDLPLHTGRNSISIIAVNNKGTESIEQTTEIFRESPKSHKPALIYVGIGVSQYADTSMNLRYASKDVADIADRLPTYGDSAMIYTLLDANATRANILSIKEKLKNTRPDDVVVVSFSGHGVLHKEKGFFFAPHDMDFKHPDRNGISMEMIEDLLDSIPAYKRLLLLDACHSGEESSYIDTNKLPQGVTATIVRGSIEEDDQVEGAKDNSYFLMKELFNDLSKGNGAFMISAAASNEFAFEGDKWKNGVFTKSFLEALGELRYSGFSGKQPVSVKELRKRIYEKVTTLTNGLQNPTSRQENGWWNWTF